ncbi:adenylate cyclase type 1-like [Vulpes vulpes]|uniref:Adenylate cyclase type 1-like n=1 Tax=Vulpes vulpes TaxID=9627 RepID=A0ABM5AVH2_VULVU
MELEMADLDFFTLKYKQAERERKYHQLQDEYFTSAVVLALTLTALFGLVYLPIIPHPCSFCSSAPSNPASSAPSAPSSYLFLHPCLLHRCLLCPFPPAPPPLPPLPLPPLALLSLLFLPLHPRPLRPFPSAPVPSTRQPPPGGLSALGLELQPQQDPGGPDTRRQEHTAVHCALRVCAPRPALRPGGHAATGHLPASVLPAQNDPAPRAHRVLHPGPGAQRLHPGLGVGALLRGPRDTHVRRCLFPRLLRVSIWAQGQCNAVSGLSFEPIMVILLFSCTLALHARQVDVLRLD